MEAVDTQELMKSSEATEKRGEAQEHRQECLLPRDLGGQSPLRNIQGPRQNFAGGWASCGKGVLEEMGDGNEEERGSLGAAEGEGY